MSSFPLKIIYTILISLVVIQVMFLALINFPLNGTLIVEAKLGVDQPAISRLGPDVRVKSSGNYQAVMESPVYFDLRSMPWFNKAEIYLTFQENGQALDGLGGQTGPGFSYDVKKPVVIRELENGWQKAVFEFDLSKVYQEKNVRRFLISARPWEPGSGGELKILDLKVILKK